MSTHPSRNRRQELSALALLDQATHLLRGVPVGTLALHYTGSVPFILGLLFFWSDMARGALAWERLFPASLMMATLFLWMRCWQAVFCSRVRAWLDQSPPLRWDPRAVSRLIRAQMIWSPLGLCALPLAILMVFPYGYTRAGYQNLCAQYAAESPPPRAVLRTASRQATTHLLQAYLLLPFLSLVAGVVFLNTAVAVALLPFLVRLLTGIESAFTMSFNALFNTTFLAVVGGLTYLVVDPLVKTVYTLRCQRADAERSGQDLLAELQRLPRRRRGMRLALVLLLGGTALLPLRAAAEAEAHIPPDALDTAIEEVMRRPQFAWRMPRDLAGTMPEGARDNALFRFFSRMMEGVRAAWRFIADTGRQFMEWLKRFQPEPPPPREARTPWSIDWHFLLRLLIVILAVLLVVALVYGVRAWRTRRKTPSAAATARSAAVDLDSETLSADEQPEDAWLALAADLIGQGDRRRALRALFLAGLAFLGRKDMIRLHRSRTNRDYRRDLENRTRHARTVIEDYRAAAGLFEWCWYGRHEPTDEEIAQFNRHWEAIRHVLET